MANLPPRIPAGHLAQAHAPAGYNPTAQQLKSPTKAQLELATQQQGLRDMRDAETSQPQRLVDLFARARVEALLQTIPDSNIASVRASGADPKTVQNWIGM